MQNGLPKAMFTFAKQCTQTRNRMFGPAVALLQSDNVMRYESRNKGRKVQKMTKPVKKTLAGLLKPAVLPSQSDIEHDNSGEDFTGPIDKNQIIQQLNNFFKQPEVKSSAMQQGLEHSTFLDAFSDFRKYCASVSPLPADLHITLSDIIAGRGTVLDLFPYFLQHSRKMYPHLECVEDLRYVSDLSSPAHWFPLARARQRKIIIHAGPTNSGKTHHAFQRFLESKSGIYCGPLKMLAVEIAKKSNGLGLACDLVTGEERNFADPEEKTQSAHVACTVEMTDIQRPIEVAIIDEIQMLRDEHRGWAWLRAFLGVNADEVHLCGEDAVVDLIKNYALDTGDSVEVRKYKRLTPIEYMDNALESLDNIRDGDCIVCFSKQHIFSLSRELEKQGRQVAVIYGGLPPGAKMTQAAKFNDPDDPCNVLIATDAVGMGLNLNIRRVIFYKLTKMGDRLRKGREQVVISPSQALQIAGRSGRFGTTHEDKGYVTTFFPEDLSLMHELLNQPIQAIERGGIHPTADQIELYGYYLPHATLNNLIDIFTALMRMDDEKYFLCHLDQFKSIATAIEHIPMPLRTRYVICCAPIPLQSSFVMTTLLKICRRFSDGEAVTVGWMKDQILWPLSKPLSVNELTHLEAVHDVLDLYSWLSYRFEDQFPDRAIIRAMQETLDDLILEGVNDITNLADGDNNIQSLTSTSAAQQTVSTKSNRQGGRINTLLKKIMVRRGDA